MEQKFLGQQFLVSQELYNPPQNQTMPSSKILLLINFLFWKNLFAPKDAPSVKDRAHGQIYRQKRGEKVVLKKWDLRKRKFVSKDTVVEPFSQEELAIQKKKKFTEDFLKHEYIDRDHIDRDRQNNNLYNTRWKTRKKHMVLTHGGNSYTQEKK